MDDIMDDAVVLGDRILWMAEQYDVTKKASSFYIMGASLYDGMLGIALYGAALYAVTGKDVYKDICEKVLASAEEFTGQIRSMGALRLGSGYSSGLSGMLRSMELIHSYLYEGKTDDAGAPTGAGASDSGRRAADKRTPGGERPRTAGASEIWNRIAEDLRSCVSRSMLFQIGKEPVTDVLGGAAGMVLVLADMLKKGSSIYPKDAGKEKILSMMKVYGRHILKKKTFSYGEFLLWEPYEASAPITGQGHGAAGIALALLSCYRVFGEKGYLDGAYDAICYENTCFDEEAGNWPDYRTDPGNKEGRRQFMSGYCSGAPGIGISRKAAAEIIRDCLEQNHSMEPEEKEKAKKLLALCEKDILRAAEYTGTRRADQSVREHLCCGEAGRIDFLIHLGKDAQKEAKERISYMVRRKEKVGEYSYHPAEGFFYKNLSMFQGDAGIGYELLRIIAPEKSNRY